MGRAWIKLYKSWYGSMSHSQLNGYGFHMGAWLLTMAGNDPAWKDNGFAYISDGKGSRLDLDSIAIRSRFTLNQTRKGIESLVDSGTIRQDGAGHYYFPKYGKWQEDSSAARHRKRRSKSVNVTREAEAEAEADVDVEESAPKDAQECAEKPPKKRQGAGGSGRLHHVTLVGRTAAAEHAGRLGRLTETEELDDIVDHHGMPLVEQVAEYVAREVSAGREGGGTWGVLFGRGGKVFEVMREKMQGGASSATNADQAAAYALEHGKAPNGWTYSQGGELIRADA